MEQLTAAAPASPSEPAAQQHCKVDLEGGESKRDVEGGGGEAPAIDSNEENNLVTSQEADEASRRKQIENQKLMRMSINTALAIGYVLRMFLVLRMF
jgi:hypothetical protein